MNGSSIATTVRRRYNEPRRRHTPPRSLSSKASAKGCCCCLFLLISFLLLLLLTVVLVVFLAVKSKKPQYDLDQVAVQYVGITPSTAETAAAFVSLNLRLVFTAVNRNKVGIKYDESRFTVMYKGIPLGRASVPGFYQAAHSVKQVETTVAVDKVNLLQGEAGDLIKDATLNDRVELRILGDVRAKIHVLDFTSPGVQVLVDCAIVISPGKQSLTYKQCGFDGVAIVKATRHEEYPAEEKHVREILSLTCYSRAYISASVSTLSRRLNKTKNWTVALKTLILIHRLLAEGDPAYEQEIFFSTRRGTRILNMSDFRDTSHSNSWDFSAFVRTYALYLDERLEFRMQGRRGKRSVFGVDEEHEEESSSTALSVRVTPVREMKIEKLFSRTHHLQQLLDRFLACRPTGASKTNRVVIVALYPMVKESFQIYYDMTEIMGILIDRFMELEVPDCVKVYEIFCRVSKQFEELDAFYNWCKTTGIARSSEYPEVEKITNKKLEIMDDFIRDKSVLAQTRRSPVKAIEYVPEPEPEPEADVVEEEVDMNTIKALPPPEGFCEETSPVQEEEKVEEPATNEPVNNVKEADLLNLADDAVTSEVHGDMLALALFDAGGGAVSASSSAPGWEAFGANSDSGDWETALVVSASNLSNKKTTLAGGFDTLLLDGMYQHGAIKAATANHGATGSASSVAIGSAGKPSAMLLALPAPPSSSSPNNGGASASNGTWDPFAASLSVAPPPYVQMSEMEKKQQLLVEEQVMWQKYTKGGMQGQIGINNLQHNPYNVGGYHHHQHTY